MKKAGLKIMIFLILNFNLLGCMTPMQTPPVAVRGNMPAQPRLELFLKIANRTNQKVKIDIIRDYEIRTLYFEPHSEKMQPLKKYGNYKAVMTVELPGLTEYNQYEEEFPILPERIVQEEGYLIGYNLIIDAQKFGWVDNNYNGYNYNNNRRSNGRVRRNKEKKVYFGENGGFLGEVKYGKKETNIKAENEIITGKAEIGGLPKLIFDILTGNFEKR